AVNLFAKPRDQQFVDRARCEYGRTPLEVQLRGSPETPIRSASFGDVAAVDLLMIVVADVAVEEQLKDVALIFGVELNDLQLHEQQLSPREGVRQDVEAKANRHPVAHRKLADKHIDLSAVGVVVVQETPVP